MEKNAKQTHSGPGKARLRGLTLVDLVRLFLDDATAEAWIAGIRWPTGPTLRGFVQDREASAAVIYSDDHRTYRGLDTLAMMERMVAGTVCRTLPYADLIADGPPARKRTAELAGVPPGHPFQP